MLFQDEELRRAWAECNVYLKDDELITYRGWLEAERDISLDSFQECLDEANWLETAAVVQSYIAYNIRLRAELWFLNRLELTFDEAEAAGFDGTLRDV